MLDDSPQIPMAHFLKSLRAAMVEYRDEPDWGRRDVMLRERSKVSEPWRYMLEAFENHDGQHEWMNAWCDSCIPLL